MDREGSGREYYWFLPYYRWLSQTTLYRPSHHADSSGFTRDERCFTNHKNFRLLPLIVCHQDTIVTITRSKGTVLDVYTLRRYQFLSRERLSHHGITLVVAHKEHCIVGPLKRYWAKDREGDT
jgi:hypothetical protein